MTIGGHQDLDFTGQVALILGASRGIGLATAQVLAGYGASVMLAARSENIIAGAAAALREAGHTAQFVTCDVADYDSVAAAVARTRDTFSGLDILVNNAGVIEPLALLAESDSALWSRAADVNYKGVYHGLRAVLPDMLAAGRGIVVNMSSGAANSALPGWSHYCSTKAAAKKLTEVAHREVGDRGVRVVGLSPGTVATDMMAKIRDSGINVVSTLEWSKHIPPLWAGEGVAFLCGPGGAAFAGQDFSIKTPEGRALVGLPQDGAPDGGH